MDKTFGYNIISSIAYVLLAISVAFLGYSAANGGGASQIAYWLVPLILTTWVLVAIRRHHWGSALTANLCFTMFAAAAAQIFLIPLGLQLIVLLFDGKTRDFLKSKNHRR